MSISSTLLYLKMILSLCAPPITIIWFFPIFSNNIRSAGKHQPKNSFSLLNHLGTSVCRVLYEKFQKTFFSLIFFILFRYIAFHFQSKNCFFNNSYTLIRIFLYIFPIHYISFRFLPFFHISIAPLYIKIYNNLWKWQVKFEYGIYNFPEKAYTLATS